jgi:acid phosphatase
VRLPLPSSRLTRAATLSLVTGLAALSFASSPTAIESVPATSYVPAFTNIYVIVMENKEYGSIVGNANAPYINSLIRHYGLATSYTAVTHPSLPNYLALWAGSTFGIRDDNVHNISARNLVDQLAAHGHSFHVYAQDVPATCSKIASAWGGVDLVGSSGYYVRKHEPAISFTDVSGNATRCAKITHLSGFSTGAASFELIVPNLTNDMHDGSIAQGDAFLRAFVPRITSSAAFAKALLVITWDEGTTTIGGGGRVATVVISPRTPAGLRSSTPHNHYSLLRTIEDAWGLGCLNQSCYANDLREFFR